MVGSIRSKETPQEMLLATKELVGSLEEKHDKATTSPNYHPLAWDLMQKLLVIDPKQRLLAYTHPFFEVSVI